MRSTLFLVLVAVLVMFLVPLQDAAGSTVNIPLIPSEPADPNGDSGGGGGYIIPLISGSHVVPGMKAYYSARNWRDRQQASVWLTAELEDRKIHGESMSFNTMIDDEDRFFWSANFWGEVIEGYSPAGGGGGQGRSFTMEGLSIHEYVQTGATQEGLVEIVCSFEIRPAFVDNLYFNYYEYVVMPEDGSSITNWGLYLSASGFRVHQPEPATAALMLLGGLAALRRRFIK